MAKKNGNGTGYEVRGTLQELYDLLKEFDTAMLVTVTPDHKLRARPMEIQDPNEIPGCELWFVTADDTAKVTEIGLDEQVCVCAYRATDRAYISISARARMDKDPAAIQRLWKPSWKAYFPNGVNDPSITLLKLTVERAEYWEPEGGRMRVLYELLRSAFTGESLEANLNPPKHV
jgi:general stress protein 26